MNIASIKMFRLINSYLISLNMSFSEDDFLELTKLIKQDVSIAAPCQFLRKVTQTYYPDSFKMHEEKTSDGFFVSPVSQWFHEVNADLSTGLTETNILSLFKSKDIINFIRMNISYL